MSFLKNLFSKTKKNQNQNQNQNENSKNLQIKFTEKIKTGFINHSPNGEKLEELWQKKLEISDEEAHLNWLFQFSILFLNSYQNWESIFKLTEIQNEMEKNLNKKKPKNQQIQKNKNSNIKMKEFAKNQESKFPIDSDLFHYAIEKDYAHPPELITEVLKTLTSLKNKLVSNMHKIFQLMDKKNSTKNIENINLLDFLELPSLEMLTILSRSEINRICLLKIGFAEEILEIGTIINTLFSHIVHSNIFFLDSGKDQDSGVLELSFQSTQNIFLVQYLVSTFLEIISNFFGIPIMNNINDMNKFPKLNLQIGNISWIFEMGLIDIILSFFDNIRKLRKRFLFNNLQYHIFFNLMNFILNIIQYPNLSRENLLRVFELVLNSFSPPIFNCPQIKILQLPISQNNKQNDENAYNFIQKTNYSILSSYSSSSKTNEDLLISQYLETTYDKIAKHFEFSLRYLILFYIAYIIKEYPFMEKLISKNIHTAKLCDFILWIVDSFRPKEIQYFIDQNSEKIQNLKIENTKLEKQKLFEQVSNSYKNEVFRTNLINDIEFIINNKQKEFFQDQLSFGRKLDQNQKKKYIQIESKIRDNSNNYIHEIFIVLQNILEISLSNAISGDKSNTPKNQGNEEVNPQNNIQNSESIHHHLFRVVLDLFDMNFHKSKINSQIRFLLKSISPDLQFEVLEFLIHLHRHTIHLINQNCWDLVFSDYFYIELNNAFIGFEETRLKLNEITKLSFQFICYSAIKDSKPNQEECTVLLNLIQKNKFNFNVVWQSLETLYEIFQNNFQATLKSLQNTHSYTIFSHMILEIFQYQSYQNFKNWQQKNQEEKNLPNLNVLEEQYQKIKGKENTLQILDKLFELLDLYFSEESSRKAIFMDRANPTCFIKSLLYGLLLSEKSEDYCLFQLNKIMLSIPENGDLSVCIMILNSFIEFVIQSFQKLQKTYSINQENSQNMGKCERYYKIIKSLIFSGILWIINNQQILQTLFANTGFFQMLATVLSFSKNEYSFIDIVLQILIELFRGNRENVIKFETEIGFETLARFIKQDHTEKTSQKTFDLIFEMIVGSNPINPNFQKEISQQKDEYFTFKNLSSNFTHEKFFANLQKNTKNEFSIQCPQAVPVIFDIFSPGITSTKVFQEFLKKFTEMCSNSIHNVSCCSEVGLLSQIIKLLPVIFENQEIVNGKTQDNQNIEKYMIELLGLIGSHSITVSELKSYVGLLRSVEDKFRSQNVSQILHALQIMFKLKYSENEMNPHTFFNFDGRTTFLELPKIQSWPAIRGFAFLTWMRIESLQDPLKKPNYEPRLFSFMNENSEGLELYLQSNEKLDDENWEVTQSSQLGIPKGNALQKQNLSQKSIHSSSKTISMNLVFKTSSTVAKDMACFNELKMEMKKWIFISVVHSSSKNSLGQECKVYIDGKLIGKLPMKFPTFNSELTHNRIGSNFAIPKSGILRENHFYGQMGAIYFFNDTLSAYQIEKIFKLGPDYLSSFEEQTTLQSNPENNSLRRTSSNQVISTIKNTANEQNQQNIQNYIPFSSNILHGSLSEKIFLNFNSKACNLNYCFDQSPNSLIVKARYFGMLKTVLLDFEDIIHCLGGIEILFPLFVQLDQPISSQENLKIYKKIEDLQNINDLKSSLNYEKILRPKKMIEELKPQFNSTEIQNGNYNEIENETKKLYQKLNFSVDTDASAQIFELIIDLLIRSTTNQDDMIRSNGFSIISYLFQSISPTHMTTQILKITKKFLLNIKRKELLESFIKDFILEFDNWILTDFAVQNKIIEKIIWRLLIHNENNRTGVDFSDLYNILRCYYWFSQETYSRGYDEKHHLITEKLLGFRPSKEQIQKLRFKILKILEYISLRNFTKKNIIQLILYCVEMKNISHLEEIKDVLFIIHKIIATNQECRKYDEEFSPFNSEEFSFDYNLEDSKNKNKNKNKNKKKKKKKDEKNEIPLNIIKNENENDEDEDDDDDIDWDSDIEDNFLNINSCIVQTRKEKTRSIRDVELDNKQKIIESLETVGYFNPFIILLDTNQNEIREISLHIIYDLLHYSYFKLENKYKSQFDDVYILIHDILMKYTFTNQIRKTLFSILVLSQNELKAGYLFIRADGVLQTIFEDIANNIMLDENYQNLKSIFILLTKNEQNQKVFLNKKGWQIWLLDLLIKMNEKKKEKKAEEEKHLKLIEKLVHKFFSFLFGYYMQFQSDGWKTFEKVIFSIRTLPFDSFDDENKLMNRIFKNSIEICNTIFKQYNEIMVTSSNINTSNWKEVNIFFDNFCHTILCIISFLNIRTQFINENDEDDENENYEDRNENENNENQN
ncbi:beach domain-containing protein lvsc [Anaeramoeba ignava]|uniref:Beach domain-containing protein lvsc n=1 Tax=Anaeramoeba ignava TaxID=1746090 RepID=A0A9Q0L8U8_ANAIG|nr:beach domain-containing protein lvsc [Anaeramoeba ignava]